MTTNLQMGISYTIGRAVSKDGPVCLGEVLEGPGVKRYDISHGKNLGGMEVILYKDLGKAGSKRIGAVDASFNFTKIVHIIEEMITYDLKRENEN